MDAQHPYVQFFNLKEGREEGKKGKKERKEEKASKVGREVK